MKMIYILLTRTRTLNSRLIHAATCDEYTHVAIALDPELKELYSFARLYAYAPLPAGFVQENLQTAVYARNKKANCMLYQMAVADEQYDFICTRINQMKESKDTYHYSVLGLLLCKMDFAHERYSHMFCSQFVSRLLEEAGAVILPKPSSLMRPIDFTRLSGLHCCYKGTIGGCITWYDGKEQPRNVSNTSYA